MFPTARHHFAVIGGAAAIAGIATLFGYLSDGAARQYQSRLREPVAAVEAVAPVSPKHLPPTPLVPREPERKTEILESSEGRPVLVKVKPPAPPTEAIPDPPVVAELAAVAEIPPSPELDGYREIPYRLTNPQHEVRQWERSGHAIFAVASGQNLYVRGDSGFRLADLGEFKRKYSFRACHLDGPLESSLVHEAGAGFPLETNPQALLFFIHPVDRSLLDDEKKAIEKAGLSAADVERAVGKIVESDRTLTFRLEEIVPKTAPGEKTGQKS